MKKSKQLPSKRWMYALCSLRRRPFTWLSGAAVLFCLLTVLTLSLFLSESTYLTEQMNVRYGAHYGVLYRLDSIQYRTFVQNQDALGEMGMTDVLVVPVYGCMEDVESEERLLFVTVLTESLTDWFRLSYTDAEETQVRVGKTDILLPEENLYLPDGWNTYYTEGAKRSYFFHGQDHDGNTVTDPITRPLTTHYVTSNMADLPYALVSLDTAEEILRTAGGELTYDVYFRTEYASDYAVAQILDALLPALHWPDGDVTYKDRFVQRLGTNNEVRRIYYQDFINYDLLDMVSREYMYDSSFFFLLLPTIVAAAFAVSGILRDEIEEHRKEYGILKASGASPFTLYVNIGVMALCMIALALVPTFGVVFLVGKEWIISMSGLFAEAGIPITWGIPYGNLCKVYLYVLLGTVLLVWLRTRKWFRDTPACLLWQPATDNSLEVSTSAWQVLNAKDPVGAMVKVQFRRERKRRLYTAFTNALLMSVCGYMLSMVLTDASSLQGITSGLYAAFLYGTYLLLLILTACSEVRQSRREFAILQQCGTSEKTLRHRMLCMQRRAAWMGVGITVVLFLALLLPVVLSGWVWGDTAALHYLQSASYLLGVGRAAGIAVILEIGNVWLGQFVIRIPMKRMEKRGILSALRSVE